MNRLTLIGVILIVLGLVGFFVPRLAFTEEETVIDAGPLQLEVQQRRAVNVPDVASGAAVAAGVVLVVVGGTRR